MTAVVSKGVTSINIRPEVTILSVLQHLNYRPWFALAEFVDNALDSFLRYQSQLEAVDGLSARLVVDIEINVDQAGQIIVRDNAAGIFEGEFPRAFRPAELPPDRSGLSEFGMGMKSAACWFAKQWTVRTSALGEAVERTVSFDIDHIVADRVDSIAVKSRPIDEGAHFTEISLFNLHHPPKGRTVTKIKDHLASIYRVFLRERKLTLTFNGEELRYDDPAVLNAPHHKDLKGAVVSWRKEIDFDFGQGQCVKGFAALREVASTAYAGFALFRRNRLIEGSADETYRPLKIFRSPNSYTYQRLFGELHIEGFEVSHTKDGFRWEEYEEIFLDCLKEELEKKPLKLLDQAEGHRSRQNRKTIQVQAQTATDHVAEVVEKDVPPVLQKEAMEPSQPGPIPESVPKSDLQASERTVFVESGTQYWEVTLRTTVDPAIGQWLRLGDTTRRRHQDRDIRGITIDVSLAHPFSQQFLGANSENLELMIRFATGVTLALVMAADATGTQPAFALHHLNTLLRDALSHT